MGLLQLSQQLPELLQLQLQLQLVVLLENDAVQHLAHANSAIGEARHTQDFNSCDFFIPPKNGMLLPLTQITKISCGPMILTMTYGLLIPGNTNSEQTWAQHIYVLLFYTLFLIIPFGQVCKDVFQISVHCNWGPVSRSVPFPGGQVVEKHFGAWHERWQCQTWRKIFLVDHGQSILFMIFVLWFCCLLFFKWFCLPPVSMGTHHDRLWRVKPSRMEIFKWFTMSDLRQLEILSPPIWWLKIPAEQIYENQILQIHIPVFKDGK